MFLSSPYSNVFREIRAFVCAWLKIANFRRFKKRKQFHTTVCSYVYQRNYILMESPFDTKEFGASFNRVCQSMRELRLYN